MPTITVSWTTASLVMHSLPFVGSRTTLTNSDFWLFASQAESQMRAKLSQRYTLPVADAQGVLETLATDLAAYRALRRVFTAEKLNNSEWPDRYKEANELLDQIADGTVPLINSEGTAITPSASGVPYSSTKNFLPTFTEDDERMQSVDSDKIEDIRQDRGIG